MGAVQADPDLLDAVAYIVKQASASLDGVRIDLAGRTGALAPGGGVPSIRAANHDLAAAAAAFLSDTRDEIAAMSEYLNLAAEAARKADGAP
jgi:hypothetical protein